MARPKGKKDSKPRKRKNPIKILEKVANAPIFTSETSPEERIEFTLGAEKELDALEAKALEVVDPKVDEQAACDFYIMLIHFFGLHPRFKKLREVKAADIYFSPALGRIYAKHFKELLGDNLDSVTVIVGTITIIGSAYEPKPKPEVAKQNHGYPSPQGDGEINADEKTSSQIN